MAARRRRLLPGPAAGKAGEGHPAGAVCSKRRAAQRQSARQRQLQPCWSRRDGSGAMRSGPCHGGAVAQPALQPPAPRRLPSVLPPPPPSRPRTSTHMHTPEGLRKQRAHACDGLPLCQNLVLQLPLLLILLAGCCIRRSRTCARCGLGRAVGGGRATAAACCRRGCCCCCGGAGLAVGLRGGLVLHRDGHGGAAVGRRGRHRSRLRRHAEAVCGHSAARHVLLRAGAACCWPCHPRDVRRRNLSAVVPAAQGPYRARGQRRSARRHAGAAVLSTTATPPVPLSMLPACSCTCAGSGCLRRQPCTRVRRRRRLPPSVDSCLQHRHAGPAICVLQMLSNALLCAVGAVERLIEAAPGRKLNVLAAD